MTHPIFKRELGHLSVAIFENEREGDRTPMRSISLSRRYFDRGEDQWKSSTMSVNPADVPTLHRLLGPVEQFLLDTDQ